MDGFQHKTTEYCSLGISIGSVLVPDQHHDPQGLAGVILTNVASESNVFLYSPEDR